MEAAQLRIALVFGKYAAEEKETQRKYEQIGQMRRDALRGVQCDRTRRNRAALRPLSEQTLALILRQRRRSHFRLWRVYLGAGNRTRRTGLCGEGGAHECLLFRLLFQTIERALEKHKLRTGKWRKNEFDWG